MIWNIILESMVLLEHMWMMTVESTSYLVFPDILHKEKLYFLQLVTQMTTTIGKDKYLLGYTTSR